MKHAHLALAFLLTAACGVLQKKDESPKDDGAPAKHVVAVVDEGFDIDNTVFKDRVTASYRVACVNTGKNPLVKLSPEMRFDDLKSQFLAYLKNRSDCVAKPKLNDGISPAFANIEGQFNDWNAAVVGGTLEANPNRAVIQEILGGENHKYGYHGTATAGLIARDAPKNVEMILIEPDLLQLMLPNDVYMDLGCRKQVEIDLKAQLFEDEEVRKEFVNADRVDADSVIMGLFTQHQVRMINESYGPTSAGEFVDYYTKKQCAVPDFKRLFLAESRLMREREAALDAKFDYQPLHVRAAGNASKELNLESDTLDPCKDEDDYLLVGALDRLDQTATFSNRGRCAEVYTLGAQVIVDAPRNFRNVMDGTSFAAPLMVRYLVLNTDPGLDAAALKKFARDKMDPSQRIKLADWDRPFAYTPKVAPAQDGQAQPQPGPGPQPAGEYKEGWTPELVQQHTDECVRALTEDGTAQQTAQTYCQCAIQGLAKKYTYEDANNADDDVIAADPVVTQCRQQAGL